MRRAASRAFRPAARFPYDARTPGPLLDRGRKETISMIRRLSKPFFPCLFLLAIAAGWATHEFNTTVTKKEKDSLSHVMQLTHGFDRAGEAYFSSDMRWIIFQAVP